MSSPLLLGIVRFISSFFFYIIETTGRPVNPEMFLAIKQIVNYVLGFGSLICFILFVIGIILLVVSKEPNEKFKRSDAMKFGWDKAKKYIWRSIVIIFVALILNILYQFAV